MKCWGLFITLPGILSIFRDHASSCSTYSGLLAFDDRLTTTSMELSSGPSSLSGSMASLSSGAVEFPREKVDQIIFPNHSERERYSCIICKHTLNPPVQQTLCGHRMCRTCLEDSLSTGEAIKCPGGEDDCVILNDHTNTFPDKGILREMFRLPVKCINDRYGCNVNIVLKDLLAHESDCGYTPYECPNNQFGCSELITRTTQDSHLQTCKVSTCKYCKQKFLHKILQAHEKSCLNTEHSCQFESVGCNVKDVAKKLDDHAKADAHKHAEFLLVGVNSLQADLNRTKDSLLARRSNVSDIDQIVKNLADKFQKSQERYKQTQKQIAVQNQKILTVQQGTEDKFKDMKRMLEDMRIAQEQMKRKVETLPTSSGGSADALALAPELSRVQNLLAAQEIQFREFDLRFQCLETASYDGVLIWKIQDYRRRKQEAIQGRILSLYSQPFYTSKYGYKMCARVYLNGDGIGKTTHTSLFFVIMRGDFDTLLPWPFMQKVTLQLLDQVSGTQHLSDTFRPDSGSSSFRRPNSDMNTASGLPQFALQSNLEKSPYLVDDTIYFKVVVDPVVPGVSN